MSAVKDIEFTQIAADWNSIKLGEESPQALLAMRNGLTTKQDQDKGDYKVSRIETIGGGWIDDTRVRFASDVREKDVENYRIQKGDILFSHINSDPHLGKTGFAERDYEDLLHGMNLLLIRANPEVFEAAFLNRVFQYYRNIGVFISICSRSVNQSSINQAKLKAVEVPLPPLPEQKKIAHILSKVQRAIEAQERIIQTTTELKKALMHKLFTEGLPRRSLGEGGPPRHEPQKQTEIGPVPESWEVCKVGDLGKCVTGSTPKTNVASFYDPPSEDFIAPADLGARRYVYDSEKKISPEGMATIRPLPKNAVMCVCIGSSIGKVGMSYREESATNQQINSIICKKGRDPEFVYFLLSYHWEYWKSFATFGPVPILSKGRFATIVVAIPSSVEEQQAIAKPLIALETKVEVAEKKVAALQDLFRTLLHELMTAKTRVYELAV
jgi:type I restriction enzyme S subunit